MSAIDEATNDLKVARIGIYKLGETFKQLQSHSLSILTLSDQWQNLQNSFGKVQNVLENRVREFEAKNREIDATNNGLENMKKEVELKKKELELEEKSLRERSKRVEIREKQLKDWYERLILEKKEIEERYKAVKLREEWFLERFERVRAVEEACCGREDECRKHEESCCEREKVLKENVEKMELRAKELKELESREKELNERIQKRCLEVEKREKAVEENCRAVEVREEKIDRRIRELEAMEEGIDERCRLIELEEKRIEERCESVGLKEREVEERYAVQELRDKQLSERCEGLESKEKGLIEKMEEMKVKVREVEELCEAQELRDKQLSERCEGLALKEKGLIEKMEEMKGKEREVEERCKAVELREREIDELCKAQELRDKQLNERCKGLELKERHIDERLRELESKLKETDEACEKLEFRRKQMLEYTGENNSNEKCGGLGNKEKCMNECDKGGIEMNDGFQNLTLKQYVMKDGVTLQMFLNDRVDVHRFMDEEVSSALELSHMPHKLVLDALIGFYPPHLSKGNFMYEASAARSSCVLLLKQLINMKRYIGKKLKRKAKGLALFWKERMMVEGEDQIVVLSFLLLVVAYDLRSYFERDELQRLYEILNKDRIALELGRELNLLSASEGSSMASGSFEVQTRQLQSNVMQVIDADASSAMNNCNKVHSLCLSMDANGLRSYIGQHLMEQSVHLEKVRDALQCAPDPAKLLLDVVQIFNQPKSTAVEKTSCIYLLELLMKLQKQQPSINLFGQTEQLVKPPLKITNTLRHKANEFACTWKQTLANKGCKLVEAYGFLQLVATYRLERSFEEDELLQLFKQCYGGDLVYRPEQNPRLCHALGLTKRIPGLVNTLVEGDRRLQAVKYICTFMMESRFPLVPLLKDHLKVIEEKSVKLQKGRNYHAAKIDAAHFEIRNLKAVLQYINDYRLESKFSPVPLESRIEELEIQIAEVKTATTGEARGAIVRKEGVKDNISIDLEMDVEDGSNELEKKEENIYLLQASLADRSEQSGGNKRTSNPCNSLELPQVKRPRAGDLESPVSPNVPKACPMNTDSGSTQLCPQPMRQLGPCTSGHQSHVRPNGLPVLPPETLPAVSRSSVQYGNPLSSNGVTPYGGKGQFGPTVGSYPGGSNVELKTASLEVKQVAATECTIVEKDKSKENASHLVNEPEKKLPLTPYAQTAPEFGGNKQSSSPCTSLVSPRLEKQLRPEALQSQFPSNIPIVRPVTTHSMPVNPPQPSPQLWRQPVPYPFEHQAYVGSNGFPMWHPGPWPAVNGSNAHIGVPGRNYGTPYAGFGQLIPAGTWTGQVNPADVFHYGNPPRPGYFATGGQVPSRPR